MSGQDTVTPTGQRLLAVTVDDLPGAGALLDALRASGFRIAPLAEVLADPVFALKDTYSGPKGLSWFYRTRSDAFERLGAGDNSEAERITNRFLSGR